MQLVPSVVRKSESWSSSSSPPSTIFQNSEALKTILYSSANIIPNEIVKCLFEYEVKTEQSSCYSVNILCKFSNKAELDKFETLYNNGQLEKRLEQYFKTNISHSQYGVYPKTVNEEFKLEVVIREKTTIPQKKLSSTESIKPR